MNGPARVTSDRFGRKGFGFSEPAVQTIAKATNLAVDGTGRSSTQNREARCQITSSAPLASTRVGRVHVPPRPNTVAEVANQQQSSTLIHEPRSAVETNSKVEKSSQHENVTFTPSVVPQALYVSAASRNLNEPLQHHAKVDYISRSAGCTRNPHELSSPSTTTFCPEDTSYLDQLTIKHAEILVANYK